MNDWLCYTGKGYCWFKNRYDLWTKDIADSRTGMICGQRILLNQEQVWFVDKGYCWFKNMHTIWGTVRKCMIQEHVSMIFGAWMYDKWTKAIPYSYRYEHTSICKPMALLIQLLRYTKTHECGSVLNVFIRMFYSLFSFALLECSKYIRLP